MVTAAVLTGKQEIQPASGATPVVDPAKADSSIPIGVEATRQTGGTAPADTTAAPLVAEKPLTGKEKEDQERKVAEERAVVERLAWKAIGKNGEACLAVPDASVQGYMLQMTGLLAGQANVDPSTAMTLMRIAGTFEQNKFLSTADQKAVADIMFNSMVKLPEGELQGRPGFLISSTEDTLLKLSRWLSGKLASSSDESLGKASMEIFGLAGRKTQCSAEGTSLDAEDHVRLVHAFAYLREAFKQTGEFSGAVETVQADLAAKAAEKAAKAAARQPFELH